MSMNSGNQTDVERLLAVAGPRDSVPTDRFERMRAAVHDAWTRETRPRANRVLAWTFVAAAVAAAVVITLERTTPEAKPGTGLDAPAVAAAVHIRTGPAERRHIPLPGGGELRVDALSEVTIAGGGEIHISKGGLYLDSRGSTLPAVITPAGRITDIGTRFEVRLVVRTVTRGGVTAEGTDTRVRVREGKVRFAPAVMPTAVTEVSAAEELVVRTGASVESMTHRHANPFGAEWAWVARAAPRFDLEGKSLGSFLDWIGQEGAWTIGFASAALEKRARSIVLHGSVEGMSTTEALEAILPACGLVHRVDPQTGRVTIAGEGQQ